MAIVKPEMKSYLWLRTVDGFIQEVEKEVIMFCPLIRDEISKTGMGYSKTCPISLPEYVKPAGLGLLLDYCRFHCIRGYSTKECKTFDEQFIRMDKHKLLQLTCTADALQLDPLVHLCSKEFTRVIAGKTPEQINEIFGLPDDQTEVEKLAPLEDFDDGHHVRLRNRLKARKREQLEEGQKLMNVEVEGETMDEHSVDDLLSFINGANRGTKGTKANKKKNKNRRKKGNAKDPSTNENENFNEESSPLLECHNVNSDIFLESSSSKNLRMQDLSPVKFSSPNLDFIDDDLDDDLDPALKEKVDMEVKDFERILNMNFSDRLPEISSFDHDSRPISSLVKGDGSTHSNTLSN